MKTAFMKILIGAAFYCNGNYCIKRSTRTADVYRKPDGERFGRFYFRTDELCYSDRSESADNPTKRPLRTR